MLTILWYALLAIFGACARHLFQNEDAHLIHIGARSGTSGTIKLVGGCMVSAFAGVLIYFVTHALNLGQDWAFAIAGISGWIGPQFLDLVANILSHQIGGGNIIPIVQANQITNTHIAVDSHDQINTETVINSQQTIINEHEDIG
ncbi:MAG: phage holin family protein [Oscillospiraceae bacterium]|jgi:hypothetical protein|nr:phage holin family protein [Oscillospiraceae bacterium]